VAAAVALVLATVTAFAIPLAVAMARLLESRALDGLQGTVEQLALVLDVTTRDCAELQLRVAQVGGGSAAVTVVGSDGLVVATTAGPEGLQLGEEVGEATSGRVGRRVGDGRVAVATLLTTAVCGRPLVLQAAAPDTDLRRSVVIAWTSIAAVAGVVAVLAAGVGAGLARRLARPFEALTAAAARLGQGDFSVRAPRSGLEEADHIAMALDGTAERLGRAIERSATFTADASHQLRTPLTALRLHLESLEGTGADPATVSAALTEADRLETTIAELTALTRLDTPEVAVDLGALVAARVETWRSAAHEAGREVRAQLLPVPPVQIRPAAVAQAVEVLVDNALRHGRGTITVRVAPARPDDPDGAVRLRVADEGEATALERPGGRGLPLARTLVTGEGGQLTVTSGPEGTAATIVLPAVHAGDAAAQPLSARRGSSASR
jgi:signal transduction histidine kinase